MKKLLKILGFGLLSLNLSCSSLPKETKNPLEQIIITENKKTFDKGTLEKRDNIHVLHLRGTPYEMGLQHGMLLKQEIKEGAVPHYTYFIENSVSKNLKDDEFTKFFLKSFVNYYYILPFQPKIPKDAKDEIKGLVDATGIPYNTYLKLVTIPDTGSALVNEVYNFLEKDLEVFENIPSSLGCSGFIISKKGTKNKKLMHGRNLDYQGVGFWDKSPTIIFYHPNKGQKYVSITSAGVGLAGLTAMNESGLTLALHQNHSTEVSTSGTPIMAINNEVIRNAHNIDEAIEIITKLKPSAGWSILISDWKNQKAVVVETSSEKIKIRKLEKKHLVATNHYIIEEMKKTERNLTPIRNIESKVRYNRLEQLLNQQFGILDIQSAIKFLGDNYDPYLKKERVFINTITKGSNLSSVLFVPEEGNFWVANGKVPASNSTYIGFNINDSIKLPNYDGNKLKSKNKISAMNYYLKASDEESIQKTLDLLEKCIQEDPEEPLYYNDMGFLLLKEKKFEKALYIFQKATNLEQTSYRKALNYVWLGHVQDILNHREEAKESYKKALQTSRMPTIIKSANNGLNFKYKKERIKKLKFDFSLGDVIRE